MPRTSHARIIRIGHDYVKLVDADTNLVILTENKGDAGCYSEAGAATVMEMLRGMYPQREVVREVVH